MTSIGLDRDAAALLVIQSDEPGVASAAEIERIEHWCAEHHATEVIATDDPEIGMQFVVARRMAIPAVERRGPLLLEDVGVPIPRLGALVSGIADIAEAAKLRDVDPGLTKRCRPGSATTSALVRRVRQSTSRSGRALHIYRIRSQQDDLALAIDGYAQPTLTTSSAV